MNIQELYDKLKVMIEYCPDETIYYSMHSINDIRVNDTNIPLDSIFIDMGSGKIILCPKDEAEVV